MLQIYTDASLSYKKIAPKKYLAGIGIGAIEKNKNGKVLSVRKICERLDTLYIKKLLDFPGLAITNSFLELLAVIKALNMFAPYYDNISVYTDNFLAANAFNDDVQYRKKILRRTPNEKYLFSEFVKMMDGWDGNLKVIHIKGHSGIYYNSMADYLSRYWLDKDIAMNRIKNCKNIQELNAIKKCTNIEHSWANQGRIFPYEEFLATELDRCA